MSLSFKSKLEEEVYAYLRDILPEYEFEYNARPDFLKNVNTNHNLELDFYCKELKLAIECNGRQHYEYVEFFHKDREGFTAMKERDEMKIDLCKKNSVHLIIIKFDCNNKYETLKKEIDNYMKSIKCETKTEDEFEIKTYIEVLNGVYCKYDKETKILTLCKYDKGLLTGYYYRYYCLKVPDVKKMYNLYDSIEFRNLTLEDIDKTNMILVDVRLYNIDYKHPTKYTEWYSGKFNVNTCFIYKDIMINKRKIYKLEELLSF